MRISDWSSDVCSSDLLMREHVALDLADRVDRDVDDDQEAGAAKLERQARLRDEIFGDQTDRRQIGRTEHGDARQHEIEIGGGVLARADARNETILLLEIVGGFFGIEDDRDVEEAEEDAARGRIGRESCRESVCQYVSVSGVT